VLAAVFIESSPLISSANNLQWLMYIPTEVVLTVMAAATGTQSKRHNNVDERIVIYV
jgi:hypothetical protein